MSYTYALPPADAVAYGDWSYEAVSTYAGFSRIKRGTFDGVIRPDAILPYLILFHSSAAHTVHSV
jgi:hypothetical protein